MALQLETYTIWLALFLSAIAAVVTAPTSAMEASRKMQVLLLITTASEAVATDGAVGGDPTFPVSP